MKTLLSAIFITGVVCLCGSVSAAPLEKVGGRGAETLKGWQRTQTGLPRGATFALSRSDTPLMRVAFVDVESRDLDLAIRTALERFGYGSIAVDARAVIEETKQLDKEGHGAAIIGRADKKGTPVRFAGVVLYGSLDSGPRTSGVHFFVAPEERYGTHGGWVPVSVFWHDLDPQTLHQDLGALGQADAKAQANVLARMTDLWIDHMVSAITRQMAVNLKALNNARVMSLCGENRDRGDGFLICD